MEDSEVESVGYELLFALTLASINKRLFFCSDQQRLSIRDIQFVVKVDSCRSSCACVYKKIVSFSWVLLEIVNLRFHEGSELLG